MTSLCFPPRGRERAVLLVHDLVVLVDRDARRGLPLLEDAAHLRRDRLRADVPVSALNAPFGSPLVVDGHDRDRHRRAVELGLEDDVFHAVGAYAPSFVPTLSTWPLFAPSAPERNLPFAGGGVMGALEDAAGAALEAAGGAADADPTGALSIGAADGTLGGGVSGRLSSPPQAATNTREAKTDLGTKHSSCAAS